MKRLITAVAFAVVAFPAMAADSGPPYDQSLVDRALPELRMDRLPVASRSSDDAPLAAASAGSTRSDVEISAEQAARVAARAPTASALASGAWAHDHHFIAPAQ